MNLDPFLFHACLMGIACIWLSIQRAFIDRKPPDFRPMRSWLDSEDT